MASKFESLMAQFDTIEKASGTTSVNALNTDEITSIIKILVDSYGTSKAFKVADMPGLVIEAVWQVAGINEDMTSSKHKKSMLTAQVLRKAKETEVTVSGKKVVLLNKPQEGNRAALWCVFPTS